MTMLVSWQGLIRVRELPHTLSLPFFNFLSSLCFLVLKQVQNKINENLCLSSNSGACDAVSGIKKRKKNLLEKHLLGIPW